MSEDPDLQILFEFESDRFVLRTGPVAIGSLLAQSLQVCYRERVLLPHAERQFDTQQPCSFEVPATRYKQFISLLWYTYRDLAARAGSSEELGLEPHVWSHPIEVALGTFDCTRGELLAIDPGCSSLRKGVNIPAMSGMWQAAAQLNYGMYGLAMTRLMAWRAPFGGLATCLALAAPDELASCESDSGMCAILDAACYPREPAQFEDAVGTFFRVCRDATACNGDGPEFERAFPVSLLANRGVVSRTFFPHGGLCSVRVRRADGNVVATCMKFSLHDDRAGVENLTIV